MIPHLLCLVLRFHEIQLDGVGKIIHTIHTIHVLDEEERLAGVSTIRLGWEENGGKESRKGSGLSCLVDFLPLSFLKRMRLQLEKPNQCIPTYFACSNKNIHRCN